MEVISGSAGKSAIQALTNGYGGDHYVKPSAKCDVLKGNSKKTWAAATGSKAVAVTLLDEDTGQSVVAYKKSEALSLIPKNQLEDYMVKKTKDGRAKEREARLKEAMEKEIQKLQLSMAGDAVEQAAKKSKDASFFAFFGLTMLQLGDEHDLMDLEGDGYEDDEMIGVKDLIKKAKAAGGKLPELKAILARWLFDRAEQETSMALARELKVDLKKFKAEAVKKYEETKAKPAEKGKAKGQGDVHDDAEDKGDEDGQE